MEKLNRNELKIDNKGRNFDQSFYDQLDSRISNINELIDYQGSVSRRQQPYYEIISYAKNNSVTIEQLNTALDFARDDNDFAWKTLKGE